MGFIFYDTETTGLEKNFEQILQFAAIQTDDDLNIQEQINLRCRRMPHIIPHPGALFTTGISCDQLDQGNVSHYEMVRELTAWLGGRCPTMLVGHNNLSYDETLIRQAFYQTLHPVFLTNTNGNCRADTIVMARAVAAHDPAAITVPTNENNKVSYRLGDLVRANGITFAENAAHEALADVGATVDLAKLLRDRSPDLWSLLMRNAVRENVLEFLGENQFYCVSYFFFNTPYTYVMASCGRNGAQIGAFDLAFDPEDYFDLSIEELVEVMNSKTKVIRSFKANEQPVLLPFEYADDRVRGGLRDGNTYESRARSISENDEFQQRVSHALSARYEGREESIHVEDKIYGGFFSNADQALMTRFHQIPWEQRYLFANEFADLRLRELGKRLVFLERPDAVPPNERDEHNTWLRQRLMAGEEVPWMTLSKAIAATRLAPEPHAQAASEIRAYLEVLSARHA